LNNNYETNFHFITITFSSVGYGINLIIQEHQMTFQF